MPDVDLEKASVDEAVEALDSDAKNGLAEDEADRRLSSAGLNTIEEEKENPFLRFLKHFWGPIPWMLEVAVILAGVAQHWEDLGVIAFMLVINGGVSFWHENRAQQAIEALKERLAPEAQVVRAGRRRKVDAKELVPGDVVVLHIGDIVPADAKLLHDQHLSADESSLTGESLPVDKGEDDVVFSGTTVDRGEARALVTATGADTKFAKTVELVEAAGERSHFQKAVMKIGYFLIAATACLVVLIVGIRAFEGDPIFDLLLFALVLTIAGIPQALPAVLTVTMTFGANRLARMKAIVSRLAAMEEVAGLEILCADKTGTLTKNQLTLQDPIVLTDDGRDDLVLAAALTADREGDDPIDTAILEGLEDVSVLDRYEIADFRPFDPTRKRAEADVRSNGDRFSVAKGAPQVILDLVEADSDERERITSKVDELGEDGFRALGVARRNGDDGWRYLGILPFLDPPREDVAEVVKNAQDDGIDIRMVTGDHAAIARQVAGQIGLGREIVKADELFSREDTKEIDESMKAKVLEAEGFAEVTPEHKFNIIRYLQTGDRIIGMTGDGVNDAPALKQADVGIAVSGATDAARAASDLVLTEPGLGVITEAVKEARRIFERMIGYATFRITETTRILLFISLSILVFDFYPVTPIMIVLLAILNDIPIITIATDNTPTARHPVRWDMPRVLALSSILGVAGVISSFILFWIVLRTIGYSEEVVQTMMFLKLLVAGHMTIFLTRTSDRMWSRPFPSLPLFLALEATQIIGTFVAVYGWLVHPIGWTRALMVWGYAFVWILILDQVKLLAYRVLNRIRPPEYTQPGRVGRYGHSEETAGDETAGGDETGADENDRGGEARAA